MRRLIAVAVVSVKSQKEERPMIRYLTKGVALLFVLALFAACSDSDHDGGRRRLGGEFVRVDIAADGDDPIEYTGTWESGEIFEQLAGTTPETLTLERDGDDFELRIFTPDGGCVTFSLENRPFSRSCGMLAVVTSID